MALTLEAEPGCPSGLAPAHPTEAPGADPTPFVRRDDKRRETLDLMVRGVRCAGCIRKIEAGLLAIPGVQGARLNLSTGRLSVAWSAGAIEPRAIIAKLSALGYAAAAFDPAVNQMTVDREGRRLLVCLAVAGFAAMNVMTFSVPVWSAGAEMDAGVRSLLHWFSALVAIPAALYAGQPFFVSAWRALRQGRANMDVPISLAVLLTLAMSLYETMHEGDVAYFDGAVMLLFLLLIGRYLDHSLREKARTAAKNLLALQAVTASRFEATGELRTVGARDVAVGDRLFLAPGERAPVNGVVEEGVSELDMSLLTGETAPVGVRPGANIHAGAVNLATPLVIRASDRAENSLVADLARLIEVSEQGRARFVRVIDKAAALYVPIVHTIAAATFLGWLVAHMVIPGAPDIGVRGALMNAVAVLIITCPCALGLAAPAVQVVATGRLFKAGILVKSGDALERLAQVDRIVMDKTGTLTHARPRLATTHDAETVQAAAALARASHHPLARALVEAAGPGLPARDVDELPGQGLATATARLGKQSFAAPDAPASKDGLAEMWFSREGRSPVRFAFEDELRPDAAEVVAALKRRGLEVELLSGDRPAAVEAAARAVGITRWRASVTPHDKIARLDDLKRQGHMPLMLGDGLNDAAALAAAHVSASPGSAIDVSQSAADIVYEGASLAPVLEMLDVARRARARVWQNIAFSGLYNIAAVPIAIAGLVTPLIAALAMSGSSLVVTLNALRLQER